MTDSGTLTVGPVGLTRQLALMRLLAAAAPVALTAGWLLGAAVQTSGYSWSTSTISDLAATTATHREVMNAGLAVAGFCLLALGAVGQSVTRLSRAVLAAAGLAVLAIVAAPLPDFGPAHTYAAWTAFLLLALWPAVGLRWGRSPLIRRCVAGFAVVLNLTLLVWTEYFPAFDLGIAERALATVTLAEITLQMFRGRTASGR